MLRNAANTAALLVATGLIYVAVGEVQAASWMINEDYKQLDARGATDFEILFQGDIGAQITGGGMGSATNPFANPARATMSQPGFNNTIVRFSGSNQIPANATTDRHFGIFGSGTKPTVLAKAWSYPTAPARVAVPKSNFDFLYNPATSTLGITIENTSPDTVSFNDVGFLLSSFERPIEDLNRSVLPPTAFNPLSNLNHTYAPGEFDTAFISSVDPSTFAITYGTVFFSGPSTGNAYNGTGGEWAQVAVASHLIPEPGTMLLMLTGLVGIGVIGCRSLRHALYHTLRNGLPALLTLSFIATTVATANADSFVVPLATPPTAGDPRPFIDLKATKADGTMVTVKTLIDTGSASKELKVTEAKSTELGLDKSTGTASTERGINGHSPSTAGVDRPPGLNVGFSNSPITPQGQAASSPSLPTDFTVGSLPSGREGTIGNGYLKMNFDASGQLDGFYYFVAKGQGATGVANAIAIASFLAFSAPVATNPNGRPAGTQFAPVTPTPPKMPAPGPNEEAIDSGFNLRLDIRSPGEPFLQDVPFIIHGGLPTTLISQSLAQQLGLNFDNLPIIQTEGNFGLMSVRQASLEIQLFDDPAFPRFTIPVGIPDSFNNPFGDNILGADVLGTLAYSEIFFNPDGSGTFFAAADLQIVPEPSTLLLLGSGLVGIGIGRKRREKGKGREKRDRLLFSG